jgi:hypothetical protein
VLNSLAANIPKVSVNFIFSDFIGKDLGAEWHSFDIL